MSISLRSASLILAALSASSVAPAQVNSAAQPLMASNASIPAAITSDSDPLAPGAVQDTITTDPGAQSAKPLTDEEVAAPAEDVTSRVETPAKPTGDLATMVAQLRGTEPGSRELECLAVGVYFEAKSEPLIGQLAVGEVIVNRATSGRFPSSYCGVLFQRSQFSFIRGKRLPSVPRASKQWQTAVAIAKIADRELKSTQAGNALFFHAKRVSPRWKLKRVAAIGNHIFYR